MPDEIDAWFDSAGARSGELRRVDELVTAAAPVGDAVAATAAGGNGYPAT
jgi:hypothetical protein